MKKVLKWIGVSLGGLILLVVVALGVLYVTATAPLRETYAVEPAALTVPEPDSALLARGAHVVEVRACAGCHGDDLGGEVFFDNALLGTLAAPNLTTGRGGIGSGFRTTDWVRAIRHGVGPTGAPLLIMPSHEFARLGRADLIALIAYLEQVPPVDRPTPAQRVGPLLPVVVRVAKMELTSAHRIDHTAPIPDDLEPDVTAEYGAYLSLTCQGCHGEDLTGRNQMGEVSSNLTRIHDWTQADFVTAVREGVRPTGDSLSAGMPRWRSLTDTEVGALWAYLQTLEPAGEATVAGPR